MNNDIRIDIRNDRDTKSAMAEFNKRLATRSAVVLDISAGEMLAKVRAEREGGAE